MNRGKAGLRCGGGSIFKAGCPKGGDALVLVGAEKKKAPWRKFFKGGGGGRRKESPPPELLSDSIRKHNPRPGGTVSRARSLSGKKRGELQRAAKSKALPWGE